VKRKASQGGRQTLVVAAGWRVGSGFVVAAVLLGIIFDVSKWPRLGLLLVAASLSVVSIFVRRLPQAKQV
jgi:hypothetical protein